ncbi:MAG: MmgE/PrpD family protein [Nitrososphaerota archaeon]|nr:MmgE/PrpD family protein [Candidatus Bathyarchaeota archaeon]MDW8023213.1 MmgE/PrpD family protein [Nitrososphaerota archaeon]
MQSHLKSGSDVDFSSDVQLLMEKIVDLDYKDLPQNIVDVAKKSILDTLGVILAASTLGEGCKEFVELAKVWGSEKGKSTVLGFGLQTSPPMAAFANGSMAHALDYEEVHDFAFVHPSAQTFPALLAVSESVGRVSGKDFITALVLGNEFTVRLGLCRTYYGEDALFLCNPPNLGVFGATLAVSKVLGLNEKQTLSALSLALCQASFSSEVMGDPNSIIRATREAFTSKVAIISAFLAQKGIKGCEKPIEGKFGLFKLYFGNRCDPSRLTREFGKTFEYANISFKPWPSCRGTHPHIQASLGIVEKHQLKPKDVEEICLLIHPMDRFLCEPLPNKRRPMTAIDAKASLPFTVATSIVHKNVDLESFTPQSLADKEVLELAKRIKYQIDPNLNKPIQGGIIVKGKNGTVYSETVYADMLFGSPKKPLSEKDLKSKFIQCAKHSAKKINENILEKLVNTILQIENVNDIREVTSMMSQ